MVETDWLLVAYNWIDLVVTSRALEMFDCVVAEQFRDNEIVLRVLSIINIQIALSRNCSAHSALNISERQNTRRTVYSLQATHSPHIAQLATTNCRHK